MANKTVERMAGLPPCWPIRPSPGGQPPLTITFGKAHPDTHDMRDRRFVAEHRGGPLAHDSHVLLARWAADCAERVLHLFARCSDDLRPRQALDIARAWAGGEVKTGKAMKASLAAHAAARQVNEKAAIAAAR